LRNQPVTPTISTKTRDVCLRSFWARVFAPRNARETETSAPASEGREGSFHHQYLASSRAPAWPLASERPAQCATRSGCWERGLTLVNLDGSVLTSFPGRTSVVMFGSIYTNSFQTLSQNIIKHLYNHIKPLQCLPYVRRPPSLPLVRSTFGHPAGRLRAGGSRTDWNGQ